MGHGTEAGQSVVDEHPREGGGGHGDRNNERGNHKLPFADEFRILEHMLSRRWENADQLGGGNAKCQQSMVERREDIPMQECAVENQVPKSDWPCLQRLLLCVRELVLEPGNDEQSQMVGNKNPQKVIQDEEEGGRNDTKLLLEVSPDGKEHLETIKKRGPIHDGVNCRGHLESNGLVQRRKNRAADTGKCVPMAKYYQVEELAGTDHEAGPR